MPVIARIVRELDGMALAIELAAARMKVLSPAKLLERLPRRFELLAQANRDASARQATLRGAIDWSWNLLSPIEQAALAQCSVFRGGFSMDALEAVLDLSGFPDPGWPPDLAQALREKSLLRCWELPDRELRFAMYESIRQYAAEKLREAGGEAAAFRRHAEFFCAGAREWGQEVLLRVDPTSIRRLSLELENVAVVHRRAAAMPPGVESGRWLLESALSLDPLFALRGPFAAQIGWLDLAIERGAQPGLEKLLLEARMARGCALMWRGRLEAAEADFVQVLETSRASRDRLWEGRALQRLARVSHLTGRLRDAARLFQEAAAIHVETGDERFQAVGNTYYADLLQQQRRFDEARPLRDRAVAAARKTGDPQFEAQNLANLGAIAQEEGKLDIALVHYLEEGKLDIALVHYLEAIGVLVPTGDVWSEAIITGYLGALRHERGEFDDAIRCYRSAIDVLREVGDARLEGLFTSYLGGALAQKGELTEARRVLEDGQRLLAGVGAPAQSVAADLQQALFELAAGVRQQALDRIGAAEHAGPGGTSLADESEDVRFGLRLLKRALG
jgi:predicted ATPase